MLPYADLRGVPPSVYIGFPLFVLPETRPGGFSSIVWRVRWTVVSWADRPVGIPSCPSPRVERVRTSRSGFASRTRRRQAVMRWRRQWDDITTTNTTTTTTTTTTSNTSLLSYYYYYNVLLLLLSLLVFEPGSWWRVLPAQVRADELGDEALDGRAGRRADQAHIYIYIYIYNICTYVYIYIYMEREREREREIQADRTKKALLCGKAGLCLSPFLRCSNSIFRRNSDDISVNSGESPVKLRRNSRRAS